MTIKEFVGYYKMAKDDAKEKTCKDRIKTTYIPILTKIAECSHLIDITTEMKNDADGTVIFKLNTPGRYIGFSIKLISLYTDLEINEGLALYEDFDELNKCGALDMLLSCIPQHEYKEFNTLLSMSLEDYMSNNRDLTEYIDKRINEFSQLGALINEANTTTEGGEANG